ncbi:MAG: hypothetical protein ACRAVC_14630 [Trichormus sp.]
MSQTPVNITYSLEEILGQINQKLDTLQKDVTEIKIGQAKMEAELKGDIKALEAELKGEIKALDMEVKGVGKQLDTQEFINRSVLVGFVLALTAGVIKLFFPSLSN